MKLPAPGPTTPAPVPAPVPPPFPAPSPAPVPQQADFADVSGYQPDVDWDKYAASGRRMAICKVTEGNDYVDSTFAGNRSNLKRLGLGCGVYHFAGSSSTNKIQKPADEAAFFLSQAGKFGPNEFPVLDFELPYGMKPAQQVQWIREWCTVVQQKTGKTPWIYTDSFMLSKMDASSLTRFPLWIANYGSHDPQHPPSSGPWPNVAAWQYTFKAPIPGIGACDDSYLYTNVPGVPVPKPTPPPKPTPTPGPTPPADEGAFRREHPGVWARRGL